MAKYRKKPVIVDAIRFLHSVDPGDTKCGDVQRWAIQWDAGEDWLYYPDKIEIPTLEGVMTASLGDWIIRGVNGE